MTIQNTLPPEDEDPCLIDDEEDDLDDDEAYWADEFVLVPDQDWEDWLAAQNLQKKHPGLILMKVTGYTPKKFREIEEWAEEYCLGSWKKIEWYGTCAYTVIIGFKNSIDAVYYKLRWT